MKANEFCIIYNYCIIYLCSYRSINSDDELDKREAGKNAEYRIQAVFKSINKQ